MERIPLGCIWHSLSTHALTAAQYQGATVLWIVDAQLRRVQSNCSDLQKAAERCTGLYSVDCLRPWRGAVPRELRTVLHGWPTVYRDLQRHHYQYEVFWRTVIPPRAARPGPAHRNPRTKRASNDTAAPRAPIDRLRRRRRSLVTWTII